MKLQTEVDDLQQDNETLNFALSQLQGQSEALRSRQARPAAEADDQRRRRGDEMRKALLSDDVGDEDDDVMEKVKRSGLIVTLVRRVNAAIDKHMPFTKDIRFIQARCGRKKKEERAVWKKVEQLETEGSRRTITISESSP